MGNNYNTETDDNALIEPAGNFWDHMREHDPEGYKRMKHLSKLVLDDLKRGNETGHVKCATPFFQVLDEARKAFYEGRPVNSSVSVDEVDADVSSEWELVSHIINIDDTEEDIYLPRVLIDGERAEYNFPEDLEGFNPERGHRYRIRLRRYRIQKFEQYDFMGILSDEIETYE